ncbi:MAG: AAA family ATPase [Succinivibrionaceae bacterium]|nr:AAA family ATPase [Succinivibrionaceae bacterium]
MKSIDTKYLPVTVADFEELREYNKIYVDKTDLIYEFARDSYPCFLSRPRRFGKSLLLSTLKSLFEHGLEYFNGLKIKELWEDKTYPVLYLDFLHFSKNDFQQFKKDLYKDLKKFAIENNVKVDPDEKNNPLSLFDDICSDMNKKFVLLIDEYDTQLSNNIDKQDKFRANA